MAFNSVHYMLFLPCLFVLYWAIPKTKIRNFILLAASYYFYMSWNAKLLVLILSSTAVSWIAARQIGIYRERNSKVASVWLALGVAINLGTLFFFKYFNFFLSSLSGILKILGFGEGGTVALSIILPVGISFYTFQALGYVIDVYRKDLSPEPSFCTYALYVSFFPQLVAGPIERASNLLPQFHTDHRFDYAQAVEGSKMILWGLFKKICIADKLAVHANVLYGNITAFSGPAIAVGTVCFAFQIYCDFSAYSDIAIGSAKLLGFDLMQNFNCPYFSGSIHEFWSRWHISLSTWLRDYIYIPLGGNRRGTARRNVNLLTTFLISGLWHGANWTYVIWGGIHGAAQIAENTFFPTKRRNDSKGWKRFGAWLVTFSVVCLCWVFFRANTISDAFYALSHLLRGWTPAGIYRSIQSLLISRKLVVYYFFTLGGLLVYDYLQYTGSNLFVWLNRMHWPVRWGAYYFLVLLVFISFLQANGGYGDAVQFIYFQF